MSPEKIAAIIVASLTFIVLAALVFRRVPKKLKTEKFTFKWRELQAYCKDKALWGQAISEADRLLDTALKRRKFKGKSMGERMVSAQRMFSDNDSVWFAHNLYKKIIADPDVKLKEADVKEALIGFRQALRDLGALDDGQQREA